MRKKEASKRARDLAAELGNGWEPWTYYRSGAGRGSWVPGAVNHDAGLRVEQDVAFGAGFSARFTEVDRHLDHCRLDLGSLPTGSTCEATPKESLDSLMAEADKRIAACREVVETARRAPIPDPRPSLYAEEDHFAVILIPRDDRQLPDAFRFFLGVALDLAADWEEDGTMLSPGRTVAASIHDHLGGDQ